VLAAIEMVQQQGFVTRSLPDDSKARRLRDRRDLSVTLRRLTEPVAIRQYGSMHVGGLTLAFAFKDSPASLLNECKRVSATGIEQHHMKVNVAALAFQQTADECSITALTFSFATQEDPATLRYEQAVTARHPR
jgi:hypothetical protein